MSGNSVLVDIKKKVKAFKKSNPKNMFYPEEIKLLVAQAIASGLTVQELSSETGISWGAIANWAKKYGFSELNIAPEQPKKVPVSSKSLIFKYPNGLEIEIAHEHLNSDLIELLKGA